MGLCEVYSHQLDKAIGFAPAIVKTYSGFQVSEVQNNV